MFPHLVLVLGLDGDDPLADALVLAQRHVVLVAPEERRRVVHVLHRDLHARPRRTQRVVGLLRLNLQREDDLRLLVDLGKKIQALHIFEVVAVIEYQGRVNASGQSAGHYICDVKEKSTGNRFRTNDNKDPVQIDQQNVSTCAYVVLYRKVIT